ncbi:MAG: hypothetical protein KO206_00780 [Methanomicrobiaceae archaeon]|nr:hypothetical protein [Methanomicrobiaceae archaeon]
MALFIEESLFGGIRGMVNIVVGFAPLEPAEFVIIKIQQIAGEMQT